jgi:hypothetical protein
MKNELRGITRTNGDCFGTDESRSSISIHPASAFGKISSNEHERCSLQSLSRGRNLGISNIMEHSFEGFNQVSLTGQRMAMKAPESMTDLTIRPN